MVITLYPADIYFFQRDLCENIFFNKVDHDNRVFFVL